MPQRMNRNLRQVGSRNEVVEPARYAIRMNRCAVILRKNPVAVNPAIAHSNSLLSLPFTVLLKKFKRLLRQLNRAYRRIRLRAFREDSLLRQVLRRPADGDHVVIEIDVLPFQPAQLSAPNSAEEKESNHHLILVWFVIQQTQKRRGLLFIKVFRFLALYLRRFHTSCRIVRNHLPEHRLVEDRRNQPVMPVRDT